MHRYYARRPYNVFERLVQHYTEPGDVILDPFCGGGVTLVEGVIQGRRVIGADLNPLSTFISRMELEAVDLAALEAAYREVRDIYEARVHHLFSTACRRCSADARALWFEYTAHCACTRCERSFRIVDAHKSGNGKWECPHCWEDVAFSPRAGTQFEVIEVHYACASCGRTEVASATDSDVATAQSMGSRLQQAELGGMWLPDALIPDCNMQRESALHKKGIKRFRDLFTERHLLALGLLKETILELHSPFQDWLLFAFSATLRYTNRMVTRNEDWRGTRPLEWAKPGYWLPAVHLEAHVGEEFARRAAAVVRGKRDYMRLVAKRPPSAASISEVCSTEAPAYSVVTGSSTSLPLPDASVDVIITDPPYGSYVHYADLSNFWAVWLPEIEGMGTVIDATEEAVIARKKFPGAKSAADYEGLLARCLSECGRVLRQDGYLTLTFHNREPRAWAALLISAARAGFDLPEGGIIFQDGVESYKHTAQSRRAGSVIGDFILSFVKGTTPREAPQSSGDTIDEEVVVGWLREVLRERGRCTPAALMALFYMKAVPQMLHLIRETAPRGEAALNSLIGQFDALTLLDSHRQQLMARHFDYDGTHWTLRQEDHVAVA